MDKDRHHTVCLTLEWHGPLPFLMQAMKGYNDLPAHQFDFFKKKNNHLHHFTLNDSRIRSPPSEQVKSW